MIEYLDSRTTYSFPYAENIERSFDKVSSISFSYLKDYLRSMASYKSEMDIMNYQKEIIGTNKHLQNAFEALINENFKLNFKT